MGAAVREGADTQKGLLMSSSSKMRGLASLMSSSASDDHILKVVLVPSAGIGKFRKEILTWAGRRPVI